MAAMTLCLDNRLSFGYPEKSLGACYRPQVEPTSYEIAFEITAPTGCDPVGAVLLVRPHRRSLEAPGYPPDQQTGYYAGRHVPKENIQRDLLSRSVPRE